MKTTRYFFLTLFIALISMSATAQQHNALKVSDIMAQIGSSQLPVAVENTDEIVGMQFDISLPNDITIGTEAKVGNRTDGHQIVIRRVYDNTYRVMLFSPENKPLRGQSGVVFYLPITIPSSAPEGSIHPITISDAVLGNPTGENVITETFSGNIRISLLPDLAVKNIAADKQTVNPGERLVVSWQVENIGDMSTQSGWSEQISLLSSDGSVNKNIATVYYNEQLAAKGTVSRQAEINLPALLGIDGKAHLQVRVVPDNNTGESASSIGNNSLTADESLTINKTLKIELQPSKVYESKDPQATLKLSRSGRWNSNEVFSITTTADSRIEIPQTVTIPANQSGATTYIKINDNTLLDSDSTINIVVSGSDYPEASATLIIEDNEFPSLNAVASKSFLQEGEVFQVTVTADRVPTEPLEISVISETTGLFSFPSTIIMPAGSNSVIFDVKALENELPGLDVSNMFILSAKNYDKAEVVVMLKDDDMPMLTLELLPNKVQEGAGPLGVSAVLRRTTNKNSKITVHLSDDSEGGIYYSTQKIQMNKGVEEVYFNLGPIDNNQVDGERTYSVTAAVWLSSCDCSAGIESAGTVSAQLQVLDDDGPALSLVSSVSNLKEGSNATLTITRNTSKDEPLTVELSSDNDSHISYNHTVTIPAGEQSVSIELKSNSNDLSDDSHTVVFTAKADGFTAGTCWLMITDRTLPDARIPAIYADVEETEVNAKATISIEVVNEGSFPLPEVTPVKLYRRGENTAVATLYTNSAIAVGDKQTLSKEITLPNTVGDNKYYAVINENKAIKELMHTNNTSSDLIIKTVSSFSAKVSVNKSIYKPEETVVITGQLSGSKTTETQVDVYLINNGAREVRSITSDSNGAFTIEWELYKQQAGQFIVGACYPGENKQEAMASFNVYGIKSANNKPVTCDVVNGESISGSIEIVNPTSLDLSEVKLEVISCPDNCIADIDIPSSISAGETVEMRYTLSGTKVSPEVKWEEVKMLITTAEGATMEYTLYFYCRSAQAKLVCGTNRISTTITKGTSRHYSFEITNTGKAETGSITLALPEFITSESGKTLPSLAPNDTATVTLRINTNEKMQLNVPVTGTIGVNSQFGGGSIINFNIEPVSEETGYLEIDVCDEYTYNTASAPHVADATVVIKHPHTGAVLHRGTTGNDGKLQIELNEGYYKVEITADKHDNYSNYCYVNPGRTEKLVVNISYQPITIDWDVEEIEIEDEYVVETTVKYETNVPMPVVKVDIPKSIDGDNMAYGEAIIINMVLTNIGLISANNVELLYPEDTDEWKFELLGSNDGFVLNPQQSVVVPIRITRYIDGVQKSAATSHVKDMVDVYRNCMIGLGARYEWFCGEDIKSNAAVERMAMKLCATSATINAIADIISGVCGGASGLPGPSGGGGGGGYGGGGYNYNGITKTIDICDPCDAKRLEEMSNLFLSFTWLGMMNGALSDAIEAYQQENPGLRFVIKKINGKIIDEGRSTIIDHYVDGGGKLIDVVIGIYGIVSACDDLNKEANDSTPKKAKASQHSWVNEFDKVAYKYIDMLNAMDSLLLYTYGDRIWFDELDDEKADFIQYAMELPDGYMPTDEELLAVRPSSVTLAQQKALIRSLNGEGICTLEEMEKLIEKFISINNAAKAKGYQSMTDYFDKAYAEYKQKYESMRGSSVCASITLQFKQTMTMTRQAFRGTLTVFNGHESTPMRNVKLNLVVKDKDGYIATAREFQINAESLDAFEGALDLTGGWTLDAQQTGVATVLFIPTKHAAPDEPVEYSFGGTVTYTDPFTGEEVTRTLYPVTMTVKPSPELDLIYFMQRDILGDNPLTENIEQMVPAEFALVINNKGNGNATNVRMLTEQPKIIENEKGVDIDFEIISSQINGEAASLSFGKNISNNFGTIPAHSQAYAQWWLQSSQMGQFVDYDIKMTHVTSYGNEDLSLLDRVTIHELIHGFTVKTDGEVPLRGFLVNDIEDGENLPDEVYFSDATQQPVHKAEDVGVVRLNDTEWILTIIPSASGWNYGSLIDPTHGKQKLIKVTRGDGTEINVDNFWQTNYIFRDGMEPLYETRLHYIGNMTFVEETFHLTFEQKPTEELCVESYKTLPEDNRVLTEQLKELTVKFNKPIAPETFTASDITLSCQGEKLDVTNITIEQLNEREYRLLLNELTLNNGYYVLTVHTADIKDNEGFCGTNGKQATWTQFIDGKVTMEITVTPSRGGTVEPESGSMDYDSDVTLKATPAEGYSFAGWYEGDKLVSYDNEFIYHIVANTELEARFMVNNYMVTFLADDSTTIVKQEILAYGSNITLPDDMPYKEGYTFAGWQNVPRTMPARDIEIFCSYSVNSYTVTFIIDGEVYDTAVVEYGTKIELPTPPEKYGYTFTGWVDVPATMPAEDITIEGSYVADAITGINTIELDLEKNEVYDLNGLRITERENLTRGTYIINGKKVYIK